MTILFGQEVKGARRWIFGIQPSEFVKPAFVVSRRGPFRKEQASASSRHHARRPALPITIVPFMLQPDFGQTMLISLVWAALFFMAGLHWFWMIGIGGWASAAAMLAFKFVPHVRARILRFIDPLDWRRHVADTFQVDTALESFIGGGWFGKGPGEGTLKRILPDSHTDFIFAVTGEEFGILACIALVAVFAFIVFRGLSLVGAQCRSVLPFRRGGLDPAFRHSELHQSGGKPPSDAGERHDLPFISYGGSSLISLALGMGFLVAVTRKRPRSEVMLEANGGIEQRWR